MLIISLIFCILSCALTTRRDITIFYNRSLLTIVLNTILLIILSKNTIIIYNSIGIYNNLFNINFTNSVFSIFILILSLLIITLNSFYPRKFNLERYNSFKILNYSFLNKIGEQYKIIEYFLIILFIIIGAILLMSSNDIISIFLSIELQSYGLYLLCSIHRNSELSTSAGLTYFLLGGLSSCFILLGTSLLYANTGITNLDNYYIINNLFDIKYKIENDYFSYTNYFLLVISIGFLFKVSAAPFHFWSPDVYDAIPTITTTFVAIVAKISIFILIFELINFTNNNNMFNISWTISLLFSSFLSLIIGTVLGLNQSRIKRLFAYSTISHLGFILLSLSVNSMESIQAFIFYLIQYSLSNLNTFILLISLGYSLYIYVNIKKEHDKLLDRNNSPIQFINQIKGFFILNPILSISLGLTLYSLIGIPPLIGFFGKQTILSSSLDQGYIFISLIAILTSVISAVYYLNIIKLIFFDKPNYITNSMIKKNLIVNKMELILFGNPKYRINPMINKKFIVKKEILLPYKNIDNFMCLSGNLTLIMSILTLIITLFIFNPEELLNLANITSILIYN